MARAHVTCVEMAFTVAALLLSTLHSSNAAEGTAASGSKVGSSTDITTDGIQVHGQTTATKTRLKRAETSYRPGAAASKDNINFDISTKMTNHFSKPDTGSDKHRQRIETENHLSQAERSNQLNAPETENSLSNVETKDNLTASNTNNKSSFSAMTSEDTNHLDTTDTSNPSGLTTAAADGQLSPPTTPGPLQAAEDYLNLTSDQVTDCLHHDGELRVSAK